MNERTITIRGTVEAVKFIAQLVREGLTFEMWVSSYGEGGIESEYSIRLTGGF